MIPKYGLNGERIISDYEKEGNERRQKMLEKDKQRKEKIAAMTPEERCEYEMKRFIKKWCFQLRKKHHGDICYLEIIARAARRFSDVYISDILEAFPPARSEVDSRGYTELEMEYLRDYQVIQHQLRNQTMERCVPELLLNDYTCSYCDKDFEQLPNAAFCPHCGKRCGAEECTLDFGDLDKYEFTHKDAEAREQAQYEERHPGWMETKRELEELLKRYKPGTSEHEKITDKLSRHNQLPEMFPAVLITGRYTSLPNKYSQGRN